MYPCSTAGHWKPCERPLTAATTLGTHKAPTTRPPYRGRLRAHIQEVRHTIDRPESPKSCHPKAQGKKNYLMAAPCTKPPELKRWASSCARESTLVIHQTDRSWCNIRRVVEMRNTFAQERMPCCRRPSHHPLQLARRMKSWRMLSTTETQQKNGAIATAAETRADLFSPRRRTRA